MPIVTTYRRSYGDPGRLNTSSGSLHSTRQKEPYVNGQYSTTKITVKPDNNPPWSQAFRAKNYLGNDSSYNFYHEQKCTQIARLRLNNTLIKSRAALGITAATANQSFAMIATRANQLRKAFVYAKKGNVVGLARTLGVKKRKSYTKDTAGLWLEYTFGWSPLVSDMYQAAGVLTDPYELSRAYGTCSAEYVAVNHYNTGSIREDDSLYRTRVVCTAGLRITNPNIALLTQLGLSNPAAVAWDIIPFSFVVDWFVKMNRFVNTWNDMAGFAYVDPVTTVTKRYNGIGLYDMGKTRYVTSTTGRRRTRQLDIINKPFRPEIVLPSVNPWLAGTSLALLVQIFKK